MKKLGIMTRKASMWVLLCLVAALCFGLVFLSLGTVAKADDDMTEGDTPAAIELTQSNVTFSVADITFTGNTNYSPEVTVTYKETSDSADVELVKDTDYTITYGNTRDVPTGEFQITGKGDYSGVVNGTFAINPVTITSSNISVAVIGGDVYYNGEALTPELSVKLGDVVLVSGTDYTVSYTNNVNAGAGNFTITGSGNVEGTYTGTFDIKAATDNAWTLLNIKGWMQGKFDAKVNTISSVVKYGRENATYSISRSDDNGAVGDLVRTFTVNADGTINDANGTIAQDLNALEAGYYRLTATVDNKVSNNFNGATTFISFNITEAAYKAPVLTLITEGAGKNDVYTGSQIAMNIQNYDASSMDVELSEGLQLVGNTLYAINAGTYTANFTLKDSGAYWENASEGQDVVTLAWTIAKKKVAVPGYGTDTFTYNGKAMTYLPEGFNADLMSISGNTATAEGDYVATITLKDTANYQWDGSAYADSAVIVHRYEIERTNEAFTVLISILIVVLVLGAGGVLLQYYMHKQRLKIFAMASESVKENNEGGNK